MFKVKTKVTDTKLDPDLLSWTNEDDDNYDDDDDDMRG